LGAVRNHRQQLEHHPKNQRHRNGGPIKTLILCLILCGSLCQAAEETPSPWWASLYHAGYFGKYAVGVLYQFSEHHEADFAVGVSSTGSTSYGQLDTSYRYSPWLYSVTEGQLWKPLQLGIFAVYSMNDGNYFVKSPPNYPSPGYYDGTDIRPGIELGSTYRFENTHLELAYRMRLIDLGITAIYNNAHRDLQYYVSSGLELHYRFGF
jgi:hypothetical protein